MAEDGNEDVVDLIEHDHREVEEMFAEFRQSHDRALAMKICDELEIHTKAEEQEIYPVLERKLATRPTTSTRPSMSTRRLANSSAGSATPQTTSTSSS